MAYSYWNSRSEEWESYENIKILLLGSHPIPSHYTYCKEDSSQSTVKWEIKADGNWHITNKGPVVLVQGELF